MRQAGWRVVEQFVEAESARTADRPEFQRMIGLSKQKEPPFTIILVWKLSRFARNREDSILYKAMLRKHGVSVVSINEHIEDSPSGRMLEGMIERRRIHLPTSTTPSNNTLFLNEARLRLRRKWRRVRRRSRSRSGHARFKRVFEMSLDLGVKA